VALSLPPASPHNSHPDSRTALPAGPGGGARRTRCQRRRPHRAHRRHLRGPSPTQVLDLLTSLRHRVIWISGNADRGLLENRRAQRDTIPDPIAPWAAAQLREDRLDLLSSLSRSLACPHGLGKVLVCHTTPRDGRRARARCPGPHTGHAIAQVHEGVQISGPAVHLEHELRQVDLRKHPLHPSPQPRRRLRLTRPLVARGPQDFCWYHAPTSRQGVTRTKRPSGSA
jgi:hypothetical protein